MHFIGITSPSALTRYRGPNSDSLFPPLAAVVVVAPKGRGFGISEYLYTPKAPGGYPPGAFGIDRTMTGE